MEKQVNVYAQLVKAQSEFESVVFDKYNPHFKSRYASLSAICNAINPSLNRNGFFLSQPWEWKEGGDIVLSTRLSHESGLVIELASCLIKKEGKTEQQFGSAITYQRRYQICSALCIVADEDDDGQVASAPTKPVSDSVTKPAVITKEQANQLKEMLKDKPEIRKLVLEKAEKQLIDQIEQRYFKGVLAFIETKLQEGAA